MRPEARQGEIARTLGGYAPLFPAPSTGGHDPGAATRSADEDSSCGHDTVVDDGVGRDFSLVLRDPTEDPMHLRLRYAALLAALAVIGIAVGTAAGLLFRAL